MTPTPSDVARGVLGEPVESHADARIRLLAHAVIRLEAAIREWAESATHWRVYQAAHTEQGDITQRGSAEWHRFSDACEALRALVVAGYDHTQPKEPA